MIPLDQNFTELFNETVPFPLPQDAQPVAPKVVPTAVTSKRKATPKASASCAPQTVAPPAVEPTAPEAAPKQERPAPEPPATFSSSTFDCHCETSYCQTGDIVGNPELALFLQPEEPQTSVSEAVVEENSVEAESKTEPAPEAQMAGEVAAENESTVSKVEINAEQSIPFEIDPSMVINRPRLTLKESGLPVALNPAEPDPSIVGESVLNFKLESPPRDTSSPDQEIHGEVSNAIVDLLEKQSDRPDTPVLKAFNPDEFSETDDISGRQWEVSDETAQACDKTLSAFLYESACEVGDEFDEDEFAEDKGAIDEAIRAEEARLAEEAEVIEAVEVAKEEEVEATEEDAESHETTATVIASEAVAEEDVASSEGVEEAAEEDVAEKAFYPMLQVDRFAWPNFCLDMHPIIKTQLGHLGDQLIDKSAKSGRNVIAVVGSGPGAGSTSILLGLATALEAAGQKVAVIDADIHSPNLASSLGLQPEYGWETVISGRLPIEESLIDSIEDRIALLPLCLDESEKITFGVRPSQNDRMNSAMQRMKEHFDLVLVDLGSPGSADIAAFSNMSEWIDSAVVVHNLRDGSRSQLIQTKNLMRDYGVSVAGIAENFAPRESCFDNDSEYRAA